MKLLESFLVGIPVGKPIGNPNHHVGSRLEFRLGFGYTLRQPEAAPDSPDLKFMVSIVLMALNRVPEIWVGGGMLACTQAPKAPNFR